MTSPVSGSGSSQPIDPTLTEQMTEQQQNDQVNELASMLTNQMPAIAKEPEVS